MKKNLNNTMSNKNLKRKLIFIILLFIIFPFLTAWVLNTNFFKYLSLGICNETWFSFIGSYVGAVATIVLAVITFIQSDRLRMFEQRPSIESIVAELDIISQLELNSLGSVPVAVASDKKGKTHLFLLKFLLYYRTAYVFQKYRLDSIRLGNYTIIGKKNDKKEFDIGNGNALQFVLNCNERDDILKYIESSTAIPIRIEIDACLWTLPDKFIQAANTYNIRITSNLHIEKENNRTKYTLQNTVFRHINGGVKNDN